MTVGLWRDRLSSCGVGDAPPPSVAKHQAGIVSGGRSQRPDGRLLNTAAAISRSQLGGLLWSVQERTQNLSPSLLRSLGSAWARLYDSYD